MVGLSITTSKVKADLNGEICHSNLDDKWETVDRVVANGVDGCLYWKTPYPGYKTAQSIDAYLKEAQNRAVPKTFSRPFFEIPVPERARQQDR